MPLLQTTNEEYGTRQAVSHGMGVLFYLYHDLVTALLLGVDPCINYYITSMGWGGGGGGGYVIHVYQRNVM